MKKETYIIGAGISGLTSAIKLAEAGGNVTIFEGKDYIGKNVNENIQAIRNYDLPYNFINRFKKEGLKLNHAKPINRIIKYAPSGRYMEVFAENDPLFYAIKRGPNQHSLDSQLYEKALELGIKVIFNQRKSLKVGDIIAVNSIYKNIWAYGAVVKGVSIDPETILFFMDNKYSPQGYIYLIPYGKHDISIAATSFDLNCPLPFLFDRFLKENPVVSKIIENASLTNYFSGAAYSNIPPTAEINGKKFVGSAAGFIDAARGFGIKYAMESGLLAAKAINESKNYDTLWKEAFENELLGEFRRRCLIEKMMNNNYEELILGDKISIKEYKKIPQSLQKVIANIHFSIKLKQWRKKFDLNKLFT